MAHALEDARSILQLRSTRASGGEVRSSVLWRYGHTTIPHHLRDIADLRGRTNEEVAEALVGSRTSASRRSRKRRSRLRLVTR